MIRKKKKFAWPRTLYNKPRIMEEDSLVAKYGLKNKREIWKTEAKVKYFRKRAKILITSDQEDQQKFFDKLNKTGLNVNTIADVLALSKEDIMKRRLTNVLFKKGIANTQKQAIQMVVHKKIMVGERVVNVPGYIVGVEEENLIKVTPSIAKSKKETAVEKSEEIAND